MKRIPFYLQILVGMALGSAIGLWLGPSAAPFGELGKVIIQLIKALAAPLLFFAILDAFLRTQVRARSAGQMVAIALFNATLALSLGLAISNLFEPGKHLSVAQNAVAGSSANASLNAAGQKIDFVKAFTGMVPASIVQPFSENAVIGIIVLTVLLGCALRQVKHESGRATLEIEAGIATLLRGTQIMLTWIIRLVPLAVFGVVARTVGTQGFSPFKGLAAYLGVALLGLALQVGIVYQGWLLLALGVRELKRFWQHGRDAVVYALGASSSLATLPVTLSSLEKMGVSPQSARLAACVGTNLNNDGILLYEAMAALFVAQAHGIDLSLGQQLLVAVSCAVAGMGIAGVPEAGLISLALVLSTVGLPTELLPLLLTVDWVLSRARAMTNVTSDMLVARLLDRFQ